MIAGADSTTASLTELRAFADRYAEAWNNCDVDTMATLLTEDIVWSDPALPAPVYGIPPVQEFMRASFRTFSNLHFSEPDPPHFTVNGDLIAWAWRMEGTMSGPADPPGFAPTGRSMRVDGVDLWTMHDGRIARYQAFYDMNDVARQLGIVPARGSGAERAMVGLQRLQARFMRR